MVAFKKPSLRIGLLCVLLIFGLPHEGGNPFALGRQHAVIIKLGGQQVARNSAGPVYRRFTRMTIGLEGVGASELKSMSVFLEPLWRKPESPDSLRPEAIQLRLHAQAFERAAVVVPLEFDKSPMAVGPYRVAVYQRRQEGFLQIVEQPFFVIFNAFDQADLASYHWRASDYLTKNMHIVQKSEDGKARLYDWKLDIDRDGVFRLAMQAVAGSQHPRKAVEQVALMTANNIEGYWPNLGVLGSRVPGEMQEPDSWKPAAIRSISQRLRYGPRHGQCFDYAAFSVALLRSAGLVATAASVMDPAGMEHPRTPNRQVFWSFHVWTEVFMDGHWSAMDITYLDPLLHQRVCWPVYPGLQPADGPWFARMIADHSRVYRQRGRHIVNITTRYSER